MRNAPPGAFDQVPMPDRGDLQAMQQYLADPTHVYSFFDGGQLMFNFELPGEGTVLFSSHLGGYERLLQSLTPRPDVAILGIAGQVRPSSRPSLTSQANDNGVPFKGSAAEYALMQARWLGEPGKIIWCLHDRAPLKVRRHPRASPTDSSAVLDRHDGRDEADRGVRRVGLRVLIGQADAIANHLARLRQAASHVPVMPCIVQRPGHATRAPARFFASTALRATGATQSAAGTLH